MSKEVKVSRKFHIGGGLYFERCPGGIVLIIKRESSLPSAKIIFEQMLKSETWISVVAALTLEGDMTSTRKVLELLHLGNPFFKSNEEG